MHKKILIADLINKKVSGSITDLEQKELDSWAQLSDDNMNLLNKYEDTEVSKVDVDLMTSFDAQDAWLKIERDINDNKRFRSLSFFMKVAAAIIVLFSLGTVIQYYQGDGLGIITPRINISSIEPGMQNAYLRVDGQKLIPLVESDEVIMAKSKTVGSISQGVLSYNQDISKDVYQIHEVVVPLKSEYHLTLPDGSKVWMNAGSKIKYQVPFSESKRVLELEGEMYIEVAPLREKPFEILTTSGTVVVTGTKFNVQSYKEDLYTITTLCEGSVTWKTNTGLERMMIPGEQLYAHNVTSEVEVRKVDAGIYTAWKDGRFVYDNCSLQSIMKSITRWYGVEFEFENPSLAEDKFTVDVKKYNNLDTILDIISNTEKVSFEPKRNKVLIKTYDK